MSNFLTYPCKTMRITQNYNGSTSHRPHVTGYPKDYPIDEGCSDTGRDYMYCPCDSMRIVKIYGVGNGGTNTIWLESTSKVNFADGTCDYFTMLVIHPNDSDLKNLRTGKVFKRGEKICLEGTDGATGNHFHFSGGKGKFKNSGWISNSNHKWVLTTTNGAAKPEDLFFVDKDFTKVISSDYIKFKYLEKTAVKSTIIKNANYEVTAAVLNVRSGPSIAYGKKKFAQLTASAQAQVLKLAKYKANGYVKGLVFTALEIKNGWARTPSGWVCLDYCKKV